MAFFSKLFKKSETSVLGIDIGSSAIKVVQLKRAHGQAILETYGEIALGPYAGLGIGQSVQLPPEKIAEALVNLMKEKEVNVTTNKCGISIPFSSSLITLMEMPHVSDKQLSLMVPIEARKYIPVPISEVMLDWSVIPGNNIDKEDKPEEGGEPVPERERKDPTVHSPPSIPTVDVLVVAIHNDTLARFHSIVAQAGLDAGFFEIEIFSTMRAVLDEAIQPVMIMDVGSSSTKLYIVERGIIRSSHTVNRGSQDITITISKSTGLPTDKAEVMKREVGLMGKDPAFSELITLTLDYVFTEANRVLLAFEQKYNKAVSKVILVGGGAALKGFGELAKEHLKTTAVLGDPFGKVSTPAFLEKILKETGPEFAVAIGLALRKLAEEEY